VICSACEQPNPDQARFCMHCAAPLARLCASCGAPLPDSARFCPQCAHAVRQPAAEPARRIQPPSGTPSDYTPKHLAEKILTQRAALEGERKQVSVLFADVTRSMELAEQMDPEEWSRIMSRFFQILSDGIERFEGFVDKFTGDAFFDWAHTRLVGVRAALSGTRRGRPGARQGERRVQRVPVGSTSGAQPGDLVRRHPARPAPVRAADSGGAGSGNEILGWALSNVVERLTLFAGELGDAPALAREGLAASERVGSPFSQEHSLARGVALVQLFQGDFPSAIASLERALAIARERHTGAEQEPNILALLARAHLGAGDVARAATLSGEALALARERGSRWGELQALDARARALLAEGDAGRAAEIEALVESTAALAEETGLRLYLPQAVELRAELAALRGDRDARGRDLRAAHGLYTEIGATGHATRLANQLRS
jgi:class 3 adenylate cyclase